MSKRNPHLTEDLCLDLLNGFLSPDDTERALAHISACAACERFFAERVAVREHMRISHRLRVGPEGELRAERERTTTRVLCGAEGPLRRPTYDVSPIPRTRGWIRRPLYGFACGAVALLAVLAVVLLHPGSEDVPESSLRWLPMMTGDPQMRTETEVTVDSDLLAGFEAYRAHDAKKAVALLRRASASGRSETIRKIYLGSALAWCGEYAEAAAVLRTVRTRILPDPWGGEAQWTLYVSLKRSGQETSADSLLRLLVDEWGEIGERARSLQEP